MEQANVSLFFSFFFFFKENLTNKQIFFGAINHCSFTKCIRATGSKFNSLKDIYFKRGPLNEKAAPKNRSNERAHFIQISTCTCSISTFNRPQSTVISCFSCLFKVGTWDINKHLHVNTQDCSQRLISIFGPPAGRWWINGCCRPSVFKQHQEKLGRDTHIN